eukprot:756319-Hanusia_phi.AAC.7
MELIFKICLSVIRDIFTYVRWFSAPDRRSKARQTREDGDCDEVARKQGDFFQGKRCTKERRGEESHRKIQSRTKIKESATKSSTQISYLCCTIPAPSIDMFDPLYLAHRPFVAPFQLTPHPQPPHHCLLLYSCLLYTSDAADDM